MWILHGVAPSAEAERLTQAAERAAAAIWPACAPADAPSPQVRVVRLKGLAAIATRFAAAPSRREAVRQALLEPAAAQRLAVAHAALLNRLALGATIAPARLAAAYPTKAALLAAVRARREVFLEDLARVAGAAEYVIKLTETAPGGSKTGGAKSRNFLRARLDARRAARARQGAATALLETLRAAGDAIARETRAQFGPNPRDPRRRAELTLLVDRRVEAELRELAETVAPVAQAAGCAVTLIGPSAPQSFVAADAPAA